MADKTIGELKKATNLDDESLLIAEQQGDAVSVTGALFKSFAQAATKGYAESASKDAATAVGAKDAAQSALHGVRDALDNLPEGDTLIINDLTTGGASAALSAEMGKTLANNTLNKAGDTMAGPLDNSVDGLGTARFYGAEYGAYLEAYRDYSKRRQLIVQNADLQPNDAYGLMMWVAETNASYSVLHTSNKPSGSYTGNGSATERKIATGGIGSCCLCYGGNNELAIATPSGAFYRSGDNFIYTVSVAFANGVLTIASNSIVNTSSVGYVYQVL